MGEDSEWNGWSLVDQGYLRVGEASEWNEWKGMVV